MSSSQYISSLFKQTPLEPIPEALLAPKSIDSVQLIDLLYDGFYIVFLLKNGYIAEQANDFRDKILALLKQFEQQARKLQFSAQDIHDAQYAYCALLDETIVSQQDTSFFQLQNIWLINPLQLNLFGSQLAGHRFFETLEQLRSHGKARLAALEIFHYCLLLGFQGHYRLNSTESLNHLVARVGDEIDFLKANKTAFAPYVALPDQIQNKIHHELPFFWILITLLCFTLISFASLYFLLSKNEQQSLANFKNIIQPSAENAHITIYLP